MLGRSRRSAAVYSGADLVVTGAYAHARADEIVIGGRDPTIAAAHDGAAVYVPLAFGVIEGS